jgi:hypothetical protein
MVAKSLAIEFDDFLATEHLSRNQSEQLQKPLAGSLLNQQLYCSKIYEIRRAIQKSSSMEL